MNLKPLLIAGIAFSLFFWGETLLGQTSNEPAAMLPSPRLTLTPSSMQSFNSPPKKSVSATAANMPVPPAEGTVGRMNYKLSPGDLFDFRVYQEPDMDSVVRIAGDGTAIFPLIGNTRIGGLTIDQATKLLASRYKQGYLVNPQISITVRQFAKKFYTIFGQVNRPGSFDMGGEDDVPLLQVIGMAGGYTKIANPAKITVKREENGKEVIIKLNAKKMATGSDRAIFLIKAGDVINVGESLF